MDDGALPRDDPAMLARTLLDLCQGVQARRIWSLEVLSDESIGVEASRIVDVFLRAFGATA